MRLTIARALRAAVVLTLIAGVSIAGASPKFVSTGTVQFPSGNLVLTFDEGGQKRFASVDYRLTATAVATSCMTLGGVTQCVAGLSHPSESVRGLVPDDKGRVAGTLTLAVNAGPGGAICTCSLHMDYTDVTLTNLTSGHVYRLEPISDGSP